MCADVSGKQKFPAFPTVIWECGFVVLYAKRAARGISLFFFVTEALSCPENQGNAPDSGKRHYRVYDTAEQRRGTAADPCYDVKLKQPDASPVQRSNDCQNQRNPIHNHHNYTPFCRGLL